MDFKDVEWRESCEEESSDSGQVLMVGCIRHGNDRINSTKSASYFEYFKPRIFWISCPKFVYVFVYPL
jgi:hypothetical protein